MPSISYIPKNVSVPTDGFGYKLATKIQTFDGTATPLTLFTITGQVIIRFTAACTTSVTAQAATRAAVGTAAQPSFLIGYTAITNLAAEEIWHDLTPDSEIEYLDVMSEAIITDDTNIILSYELGTLTAGVVNFYCFWTPLEAGSSVVAA